MGLLAATLAACDSDPDKRCVERDSYTSGKGYKVVDDKYCKDGSTSGHTWYYGGSKSGSRVKSGSFSKSSGGSGGSGVSRGGFGGGKGSSGG
ncbi:hypothetical protein [Streptomyces sp. VRA16 Mangrove soil]|uniref:hypothetical protein n=1 Tax=Streptomyces sp. VRA16 Mangrove soil TaxID=2817434 RepID=UPI001E3304C6